MGRVLTGKEEQHCGAVHFLAWIRLAWRISGASRSVHIEASQSPRSLGRPDAFGFEASPFWFIGWINALMRDCDVTSGHVAVGDCAFHLVHVSSRESASRCRVDAFQLYMAPDPVLDPVLTRASGSCWGEGAYWTMSPNAPRATVEAESVIKGRARQARAI